MPLTEDWLVLLYLGKVILFDHLRKDGHEVGLDKGAPALTARSPSHSSFAFECRRSLEGKNWPRTMELLEVVALGNMPAFPYLTQNAADSENGKIS